MALRSASGTEEPGIDDNEFDGLGEGSVTVCKRGEPFPGGTIDGKYTGIRMDNWV